MNDELRRIWKENPVAQSRYYPDICLESLTRITKHLSQIDAESGLVCCFAA
jgi:hypothetical protein